jgi:hypothetical protein
LKQRRDDLREKTQAVLDPEGKGRLFFIEYLVDHDPSIVCDLQRKNRAWASVNKRLRESGQNLAANAVRKGFDNERLYLAALVAQNVTA